MFSETTNGKRMLVTFHRPLRLDPRVEFLVRHPIKDVVDFLLRCTAEREVFGRGIVRHYIFVLLGDGNECVSSGLQMGGLVDCGGCEAAVELGRDGVAEEFKEVPLSELLI